jgi:hypothetical protein
MSTSFLPLPRLFLFLLELKELFIQLEAVIESLLSTSFLHHEFGRLGQLAPTSTSAMTNQP